MSLRAVTTLGWLLVGVSMACLIALGWAVAHRIDQWDALPLALLLYAALYAAAFAHGLCWRRGGAQLQTLAQLLVVATSLYWLHTWFAPLQDLVGWLRVTAYCWLQI